MITIKAVHDDLAGKGCHWHYGARYMQRISTVTARKLCGVYPLPRMGYETLVAITSGFNKLYVQNNSGGYWVCSSSVPVDKWPEVFGVTCVVVSTR